MSSILYLKCVTYWLMGIYVQHIIFEMCDILVYGDTCPAYYIWNVWLIGWWGYMSSILYLKCVTYWFMGIYVQHIIFEMCDILVYGDICPAYYIWNVWHIGLWGYMSSILYLKCVTYWGWGYMSSILYLKCVTYYCVLSSILYLKCVTYMYVQHIIFEMCDILVYGDICPAYYIWNVWHIGLWGYMSSILYLKCVTYWFMGIYVQHIIFEMCDILVYGDICPAYYIWNVWHIGLWGYMSSILYLKCVTYWFMGIYVQHIIFEMCDILVYGDICPAYYIWNVWHIGLWGYMSSILYLKCVTYWFMGIYVQHIIFEMCDILVYVDICHIIFEMFMGIYVQHIIFEMCDILVYGDICPAYYIWNVWLIGLWGYMSSILYLKCMTYWFMGIYVQHIIFEMCDILVYGDICPAYYIWNVWHISLWGYMSSILYLKCGLIGLWGYMSSILYLKCVTYWFMGIYVQHIIFEMCDILVYGDICPAYYIWNVWLIGLWGYMSSILYLVWHIGLWGYMSSILYLKCVTYWFMGIYVQHITFEMCDLLVDGDICPAYYIWNVWHIGLWGYMSSILYLKCVTYWFMGIYVQHIIFEMCDILVYGDICPAYYIWNVWHIGLWGYMSSILYLKCVTYWFMGIYVQHIIFEMCDILVYGDICPAYYIWNVWHMGIYVQHILMCDILAYYIRNVWLIGWWGYMSSILYLKCVTYWFMGIYAYYIWNVWHKGLWRYMSSILYLKCVTYWFMGIYVQHIIFEMCDILVYGDICPAYYIWNVWHIGLWGYMSSILYLKCVTYWFMGIYVQHIIFEMCDILVYGDICPAYYIWNVWHIGLWGYMSSILYLKCVTYWFMGIYVQHITFEMCDLLVYGDICPAYYIWNVWHIGLWGYMSSILYLKCVTY